MKLQSVSTSSTATRISAARARCCACKSTNGTTVLLCCSMLLVIATNTLLGQFEAAAAFFAGRLLTLELQSRAATANPSELACWIADHKRVRRHRLGDNGSGANCRVFADFHAGNNHGPCAQCRAAADFGWHQ